MVGWEYVGLVRMVDGFDHLGLAHSCNLDKTPLTSLTFHGELLHLSSFLAAEPSTGRKFHGYAP